MSDDDLSPFVHHHRFETGGEAAAERRTRLVTGLTLVMMAVEIAVGTLTNSMALLADGLHMFTHAGALGIAAFAYWHARRHADDRRYSFGTGKVGPLAGFASAMVLVMVSLLMVGESVHRLTAPQAIAFDEALWVAAIGLGFNLLSAMILGGHDHDHDHDHGHGHGHHDHNLRAAYLHVLADALTSVLAIVALAAGKWFGWWWLDPAMGVVGAVVILVWARGLLAQSGRVLLDMGGSPDLEAEIRAAVERDGDRIADLHLWQVGPGHWAAIVTLVTAHPRDPAHYKQLLAPVHELSHLTVEVLRHVRTEA